LHAPIRKYGGPGVPDCPLPLSTPDDAVIGPGTSLLLALAQATELALGINEQVSILFEQAIGQLDDSEVVAVPGIPVALLREYAMHRVSPQFAPDPVWTAGGLLEHYGDSRTQ
jgi:hypothetical protein